MNGRIFSALLPINQLSVICLTVIFGKSHIGGITCNLPCVLFNLSWEGQSYHCYMTRHITIVCVCVCVGGGGGGGYS